MKSLLYIYVLGNNLFAVLNVTLSQPGPIQRAVGDSLVLICSVNTLVGMNSTLIIFSWRRPGGDSIINDSRVTISPTTNSSNITYTSSLQFTYLMEGDEGNYTCNVTIMDASGSQTVELQSLTSKI